MRSILSKPYNQRRVIVVAPNTSALIDWVKFGEAIGVDGKALRKKLGAHWRVAGIDIKQAAVAIVKLHPSYWMVRWIYQKVTRSSKNFKPLLISEGEASKLMFPEGHPLVGHCYAGHPIPSARARYFPIALFHHALFEEKANDLVRLIASLGARRLKVRHIQGYRSGASISFGITEPQSTGTGGVGSGYKREINREIILEETYPTSGKPTIPKDLIWYGSEATWKEFARRRKEFHTREFQIQLTYVEDYGIDGNLIAGLQNANFKLGGTFQNFECTVWQFEGEFG